MRLRLRPFTESSFARERLSLLAYAHAVEAWTELDDRLQATGRGNDDHAWLQVALSGACCPLRDKSKYCTGTCLVSQTPLAER